MRMKKGIIAVSTIAVVILGIFFALRFIGGREIATNVKTPDASTVQKSKEVLTNDNKETNLSGNEAVQGIENIQGESIEVDSTSKMDAAYINDKTNVGIYTVKKDDTVFSIVKTYMPSYDNREILEFIKNRNSIDESYKISEGQKIVIPYELLVETSKTKEIGDTTKYVIKKQDTLTSIAKNNMPSYAIKHAIEMIKETNKILDENSIKEGSFIYIPK